MTDQKACATCSRILDLYEPADGPPRWRHTAQDGEDQADHQPVPIDPAEAPTIYRCDFCNTDESAYILPARDFLAPDLQVSNQQFQSGGDWSACTGCGRLIDLNQWTALVRRAKKAWEKRHGPMTPAVEASLSKLYRDIRKNQTGPLRPFVRPQPAPGTTSIPEWGNKRERGRDSL